MRRNPALLPAVLLGSVACFACTTAGAGAPHHPGASAKADADAHAYRYEGHAHHRFDDPEAWAKRFEDPGRDAWQKPEVVLDLLSLEPGGRVAEIGSATGYFSVRLAPRVPEGRVWGVDIEPKMVRYLNARARREGLENLFSVLGTPADPLIPEPVDRILVVNTYHHIESRPAYFRQLRSDLREGGRIAIVDFKMGELPVGPPESMRIPGPQVDAEMQEAGYRLLLAEEERLPYQWIRVYEPAKD